MAELNPLILLGFGVKQTPFVCLFAEKEQVNTLISIWITVTWRTPRSLSEKRIVQTA